MTGGLLQVPGQALVLALSQVLVLMQARTLCQRQGLTLGQALV